MSNIADMLHELFMIPFNMINGQAIHQHLANLSEYSQSSLYSIPMMLLDLITRFARVHLPR